MWDELAAAAWIDPALITKKETRYMSVDIDHGAGYGNTLTFEAKPPSTPGAQPVEIQLDLDQAKFYECSRLLCRRPLLPPPRPVRAADCFNAVRPLCLNCMDPLTEYVRGSSGGNRKKARLDQLFFCLDRKRAPGSGSARGCSSLALVRPSPFLRLVSSASVHHFRRSYRLASTSHSTPHIDVEGCGFYAAALDRLQGRWMGNGATGEKVQDPAHVYADDLDIFGKGSLFELVSRARTGPGERTLANWFLSPATREEAHARQEAVAELRDRLDLREEVALLGEDVRSGVHPEQVAAWVQTVRFHSRQYCGR